MELNSAGRQPVDLEAKILRMKAHAELRRGRNRKTGAWILGLVALVVVLVIMAGLDRTSTASAAKPCAHREQQTGRSDTAPRTGTATASSTQSAITRVAGP